MEPEKPAILLVEDSELFRLASAEALEEAGFEVRAAAGYTDLEAKIGAEPDFLTGLSLMVLDMELTEELDRMRADRGGTHTGAQMTGSQIGISLPLVHPQLTEVPFLLYSGKEDDQILAHLEELAEFAQLDDRLQRNYKGFVQKKSGGQAALVAKIVEILGPPSA